MAAKFGDILKILAQQTQQQPKPVSGAPTPFDPYAFWPTIMIGWGAQNVAIIRKVSNILNWALFIVSNGQLDMNKLRGTNFVVDQSKYPDRILLILVKFAVQVYRLIYTNIGGSYTAVVQNAPQRLQILKNSLTTLPDGQINTSLASKVGGAPKILILNLLDQIK